MWSDVLLCSNLTELSIICVRIWVHCPYKCLLCCLTSSISKKLLLPIVKHLNPYKSWHNTSMYNKQAYFAYSTLNVIMVMPSLSRIVIHTQNLVDCYSYYIEKFNINLIEYPKFIPRIQPGPFTV